MVRILFKYKPRPRGELSLAALRSLVRYFAAVTGSELMLGIIAAIRTFGDRIAFHRDLHFLMTEGGEVVMAAETGSKYFS
jgi:hypothetical protein